MTSVFSQQSSVSLCPASFCTPRPNLPVTPGNFAIPNCTGQLNTRVKYILKKTLFVSLTYNS